MSNSAQAATKTDTPEQHNWLHQRWPPENCCLCRHEALNNQAEEIIRKLLRQQPLLTAELLRLEVIKQDDPEGRF